MRFQTKALILNRKAPMRSRNPYPAANCMNAPTLLLSLVLLSLGGAAAQAPSPTGQAPAPSGNPYQGSVATGEVSAQAVDLSLDEAIQRGLKANLGVILSSAQATGARGQRLSQLQALLPSVNANIQETLMQTDLA